MEWARDAERKRRMRRPLSVALFFLASCHAADAGRPEIATVQAALVVDAAPAATSAAASHDVSVPKGEPSEDDARDRANAVVQALKSKDMDALAALAHPDRGVRFTPYSYVDDKSDVKLDARQLRGAMGDRAVRHWGDFDGTGAPINMTFAQYYARFVFDVDFTSATKRPKEFGENSIDNASQVYGKRARVIEFYWPGDPSRSGMDWRALRVVMEPKEGTYYLVGIIHAEWTI
jgi:hypothetical protein